MRRRSLLALTLSIGIAASCADHTSTANGDLAQRGVWGSSQASLIATDTGATIQILDGNCYGSYGDIAQPVPAGPFVLNGVFTQLMGAYPGKIEYAAQFSGTVDGARMTIAITVPALQRSVGPFALVHGVNTSLSRCLYP